MRAPCRCGCGETPANWAAEYIAGHRPPRPVAVRLFARVAIDDMEKCWEWQGYCKPSGHGQIGDSTKRRAGTRPTHQVAWEFFNGRPVAPGMQVNHHCDNPPCCNPRHLYEGTGQQNVDDMKRRKRMAVGESLPQTRLSESDVIDIRRSYERQYTTYQTGSHGQITRWRSNARELAERYGVNVVYLGQVVRGVERKHV